MWIEHKTPRMLRVNAVCVQQQLIGGHPLDHEVAVLAIRRFNQLDVGAHAVNQYMLWREVLEPDFSVSIPFFLVLCRHLVNVCQVAIGHETCLFFYCVYNRRILLPGRKLCI